jgi:hypothetical protein
MFREDKRGSAHVTYPKGAFAEPLLPWKNNQYYILWVCVCVTLVTQHETRIHDIANCGTSDSTVFLHITS